MKRSSAYSQGLRIKIFCSKETSLTNHLKVLRSWFCNRGYSESMVEEQLRRFENRTKDQLLCTKAGVSLIVTYHPHLDDLNKIKRKNFKHLQPNQIVISAFTFFIISYIA